jgi:integrative and conjugative element protein (TIGR02256 family)
MDTQFYPLPLFAELLNGEQFTIPRAQQLNDAVLNNNDYSLIGKFRRERDATCVGEALVIDVVCHEVPSLNEPGIQFRERMAICIGADEKQLVEALALRKSFPTLIHQNYSSPDTPANLCLYNVPTDEVFRSWTAHNFLRRIQWWLVASARNELHAADQALEQLFFNAQYELVLPWNFDDRKKELVKFYGNIGPDRKDGKTTIFLNEATAGIEPKYLQRIIEANAAPIVHGKVEREPATLGELDSIMRNRGTELMPELKQELVKDIGAKGFSIDNEESAITLILNVPITRETAGVIERFVTKAYLIKSKTSELGLKLGVILILDRKAFVDHTPANLRKTDDLSWQDIAIYPMEVQFSLNAEKARQQSSISDQGPNGVLVGYGSLGSALLNLWTRAGWGKWSVIDVDHIKPHNLARHVALNSHIGQPKVRVASDFGEAIYGDRSLVTGIYGDACNASSAPIQETLNAAELVVDASAALSYPRLASTKDTSSRHTSCFLTPDGNKSVLLLEDHEGKCRLRTLEAQYYRAILKEKWGLNHLASNLKQIRTGASCRDASIALPYSRVTAHASILAEQIMRWSKQDTAIAVVWERDEDSAVAAYNIPIFAEKTIQCADYLVSIDIGLESHLQLLRTQCLPNETGGVLLGYFDLNLKSVVIVDILSAPSDSTGTLSSFERGTEGLVEKIAEASSKTAGIVSYVGEWHSHPSGSSTRPSNQDEIQLAELTNQMHRDGFPVLQLIVAEGEIGISLGEIKKC